MADEPAPEPEVKVYVPPRETPAPAFAVNNIPIFFGCDGNFFNHAVAVIASIMEHASPANNYDFVIVQHGVPGDKMAQAVRWLKAYPNASLRFVDIVVKVAMADGETFRVTRAYNISVYYRIFAPSIFRQYDKITYMDSDVVVLADIADFHTMEMGDNLILACHDFASERQSRENAILARFWREELGLEPGGDYFLSGGAVMNLAGMRRQSTEKAFVDKIRTTTGSGLPDQDIMNAVLRGRVGFIGCEWNYLDWMADPLEESPTFHYISDDARRQIRAARDRMKVLHFAEKKPWSPEYMGKNGEYYWHYAALTPFLDDTMRRLAEQLSPARLLWRYCRFTLQLCLLRLRLSLSLGDRTKNRFRLENLRRRRSGLAPQVRRVLQWKKRGAPDQAAADKFVV